PIEGYTATSGRARLFTARRDGDLDTAGRAPRPRLVLRKPGQACTLREELGNEDTAAGGERAGRPCPRLEANTGRTSAHNIGQKSSRTTVARRCHYTRAERVRHRKLQIGSARHRSCDLWRRPAGAILVRRQCV